MRRPTFLVVDPDANGRYLTRDALESMFAGCVVVESAAVEDALAKVEQAHPDAVLTDHHLGPEDGTVLIARARARGVACPIIMVTGTSDPKVHADALAAGANRVFLNWESTYLRFLGEMFGQS